MQGNKPYPLRLIFPQDRKYLYNHQKKNMQIDLGP